jgi:hypothetical protein
VSKRARYDGPYTAVDVHLPDGEIVTVERGHQLPAEVPATVRDELLARPDWSEVQQSAPSSTAKKES